MNLNGGLFIYLPSGRRVIKKDIREWGFQDASTAYVIYKSLQRGNLDYPTEFVTENAHKFILAMDEAMKE